MVCHFVTGALMLFCMAYLASTQALPLPSYIQACSRSDPKLNECALKNGRKALPTLLKGDRKYNVPVLDPLKIDLLKLDVNGLTMAAKNVTLNGFKEVDIKKVSLDLKKRLVEVDVSMPLTEIICDYEMNGKILVLPITGSGDANISLYDTLYNFKAEFDMMKKPDGKEYISPKNPKLQFAPKNAKIYLGNLFNGDKTLGKNMNTFLNQNWREVIQELGPAVAEGIAEVILTIISSVVKNVPYDELFLK